MDLQRQKLKNRLNLKFDPNRNNPSHRYSLKKLSLGRNNRDNSQNELQSQSQSMLLSSSRNKSLSAIKLPSLEKVSNNLLNKFDSPTSKTDRPYNIDSNLNIMKQKLRVPSIKLNKIQGIERLMDSSITSNAVANLSKFNYGLEPTHFNKDVRQKMLKFQESIVEKKKQTQKSVLSHKIFQEDKQSSLNTSVLSTATKNRQNLISGVLKNQMPQKKEKKEQPKVKVESKTSIHQTLTYLIKNQILTIPKIVTLLKKSHSQEFLYMKVRGIYQFEVCDENEKGKSFITVSKNGMVIDGEMVSLEKMIHEFQMYNKLRNIRFFKHFIWAKFMAIWNKGSKKAQFIQNRASIHKLLNLQDKTFLKKIFEIKQSLILDEQSAGSITENWVNDVIESIRTKRGVAIKKLTQLCFEMLNRFGLPLSESSEMMSKLVGELKGLNIGFQVRIRIEKEVQSFYKIARSLEFQFFHLIKQFIFTHLETLKTKTIQSSRLYQNRILKPMQLLEIENDSYSTLKQQVLMNSHSIDEIDFSMRVDENSDTFVIEPSVRNIFQGIVTSLENFYEIMDKEQLKLVRIKQFSFLQKILRMNQNFTIKQLLDEKPLTLKAYVTQFHEYQTLFEKLESEVLKIENMYEKRLNLDQPFLKVYKEFKLKNSLPYTQQCLYVSIENDLKQVATKKQFCQKIHDGEYFIFGYLDLSQMKKTIVEEINKYEQNIFEFIPQMSQKQRTGLIDQVVDYLRKIGVQIATPQKYMQIVLLIQKIELEIPECSSKIVELQKIAVLYYKKTKVDLPSLTYLKNLLSQLTSKIKFFKQKRQVTYLQYRRILESEKKILIETVQKISKKSEQLYSFLSSSWIMLKMIKENIKFLIRMNLEIKHFNELEIFYGLKETRLPKLQVLLVQYESLQEIWKIYQEWEDSLHSNNDKNLFEIEAEKQVLKFEIYIRKLERYIKNIEYYQLCRYLQSRVSQYLQSMQFIAQIQFKRLREADFLLINKTLQKQLLQHQKNQQKTLPRDLWRTVDLKEEHQSTISQEIDVKKLTLRRIIDEKLYGFKNAIEEITFKCRKELEIKETIESFIVWWKNLKLSYTVLDDFPLVYIFDANNNVRRELDEYSTILVNILNHKHAGFIRKQCSNYLKNLNSLAELLKLTIQHQQKFLTLFPIMTSSYAEKHLLPEYKKFENILNKTMRNLRSLVRPTQSLNEQTRSILLNHIKHFDTILKYLEDFLQKKRVKFQRFYFLQDTEMLELLVGNSNQNHVFRMFDGIRGWLQDNDQIKIGVIGVGGQQLKLQGWTYKNNEPQLLFRTLEEFIKVNLNSIVRKILHSYESQMKELKDLYKNIPWMCIYTVQLILFTKQIQLNCFYELIPFEMQKSLLRESILVAISSPSDNSNYITLLIFLLHFTEQLQKLNVTNVFHFEWFSFLKYYHQHNNVVMRCLGDEHSWGGEYQGLWNLMVNTSDTRRVHTAVITNLKFSNGVLLQGPSGTGKTQSLKELARCMAKYCVVFNCSGEVSIQTLEKLLSGLCYTASWICLDEINRLSPEIMSVIANQINIIKNALNLGKNTFNFMGKKIHLKKGVGIFSTMNPIYLKRSTLTENLKSYFRVVSVSSPNYETILQVMLYSLGFFHAEQNAKKITRLLKNLSIQMGNHSQYDFGMRNIKILMKILSNIKKRYRKEEEAIYFAVYETFSSRLHPSDEPTFNRVMKDIIGFSPSNKNFSNDKAGSIFKSVQTGTIVVGPTSSKTTLISSFIRCIKDKKVNVEIFNSSCLEQKYLMGENILGRWNPGVLEQIAIKTIEKQNEFHVFVLDSKLKSEMIENFNTLLDESKLLTLSNGTRIKIRQNLKLIMETSDLSMTSPATITRCHVIYVDQKDLSKQDVIESVLPNLEHSKVLKFSSMLNSFQIADILKIGQIYPLFWNKQIPMKKDELGRKIIDKADVLILNENQAKGFEKVIFYTIQLLNLTDKIKNVLTKQNTIPFRKLPQNFMISFQKYEEGEFIQILCTEKPQKGFDSYWIPTVASQFCKVLTKSAIQKRRAILWYGNGFIGKTKAIKRSIKSAIQAEFPNEKKLITISIDKLMGSNEVTQAFDDRISIKNGNSTDDTIIMVENVNMCSQQSSELFRYLSQYDFLFSSKSRGLIKFQRLTSVFELNTSKGKIKKRLARHFAEIPFPQLNEFDASDVFKKLILANIAETKTTTLFKQSLSIEVEKFSVFLSDYIKKKNKMFETMTNEKNCAINKVNKISYFTILPCLNNLRIINEKFVKQPPDFVEFLLSELRRHEVELNNSCQQNRVKALDLLKLAFNESFKQKFERAYEKSLKSTEGLANEVSFYSGILTRDVQKTNWNNIKSFVYEKMSQKFYVSQFMVSELIYLIRTLQYQGGNFILVGKQGVGKKVLFKVAAELCDCKFIPLDNVQASNIKQTYFSILKQTFLKDKKVVLSIDAASKNYHEWMKFLQRLNSGFPVKFLFKSEQVEQAYGMMETSLEYHGVNKSYDEIVKDFSKIGSKNIHIFISCRMENASKTIENYRCIVKNSVIRYVKDFPIESITEISQKILENKTVNNINSKRLASAFVKLYQDLNFLIEENQKVKGHSYFKHNSISHFKFLQTYVKNQQDIVGYIKQKEDILNRAVFKVEQTQIILSKLKSEIETIQQKVQISQKALMQFRPDLEQKKARFHRLDQDFAFDKSEIITKRNEVEQIGKQIQAKRKAIEPFLKELADSILSIKRPDLNEIKIAAMHPFLKFSIENLMILLGEQETEENMKEILKDINILIRMKNCQPKIQDCGKVKKRISENPEWTLDSLSKVAFHLRFLQKWTVTMIKMSEMRYEFDLAIKLQEKLKQKLNQMEALSAQKYSLLIVAETELNEIQQKFLNKKNSLSTLQQQLTINNRKANSVENIKSNLEAYKCKWIEETQQGKQVLRNLQFITSVYTYFMKIHPFLRQADNKTVQTKLQDHLQKAMFPSGTYFDPFAFLKQRQFSSRFLLNQKPSDEKQNESKYSSILSHKNASCQDTNRENIVFLKHYFHERPIIFDPDNQALKWLHRKIQNPSIKQNGLKIIITRSSFTAAKQNVELAIREGHLLILIVQDEFDEFTTEILTSKITYSMNRRLIEYNRNLLYVDEGFQLILCNKSRRPNPSLTYFIKHQVINFQVTKQFLNMQLLDQLLLFESQTNHHLKKELQIEAKTYTEEKYKIQQQIISLLVNLKKEIFRDEKIIEVIHHGYQKIEIFDENLNNLNEKMNKIQGQISIFSELCQKASEVYFSLQIMSQMSEFFNWNVEIFIKYFIESCLHSIAQSFFNEIDEKQFFEFGKQMEQQLENYEFQNYIGNGNSRATSALSYVSAVTSRIILEEKKNQFEGELQPSIKAKKKQEVRFDEIIPNQQTFIDESKKGTINKERQRKIIERLLYHLKHSFDENQKLSWALILSLMKSTESQIKLLFIPTKIRDNIEDYIIGKEITKNMKEVFSKLQPNAKVFANQVVIHPNPFTKFAQYFSELQILLLCKLLKPNRFYELCEQMIEMKGFSKILEYKKTDVSDWLIGSDCAHPVLLMMGEDPIPELSEFFGRKHYKHITLVAMGQGQEKIAEIVLEKESRKQNIVIIHNLHICPEFFEFLSKTLQQFESKRPHKNFRLILITSLKHSIDPYVAGTCHKFLINQPNGLKNQMKCLYENIPIQLTEVNHHKIVFSICFFHSMINELQRYHDVGWNLPYQFNTSDFINAIKIFNLIIETPLTLKNYECNIEKQQLKTTISYEKVDFRGLSYLIGEMSYVGKLVNDLDRQKMRIYVKNFINREVLKEEFKFFKKYTLPKKFTQETLQNLINQISDDNSSLYGLAEGLKPSNQQISSILQYLAQCFPTHQPRSVYQKQDSQMQFLEKINHNFDFINLEIQTFNQNLTQFLYEQKQFINSSIKKQIEKNYKLLKEINSSTKIFDLRTFSNPSQFFIEIQKQASVRLQIEYEKVDLVWSIYPRQNIPCYGVKNLKLEGGSITRKETTFYLDSGKEQRDILLYVYGIQMKKKVENNSNRKLVKIPLYLNHQRQGQINSYGDNTNLLAMISMEAIQSEEYWTLRSTAFIASD